MKISDLSSEAPGQLVEVESLRGEKGLAFLPALLPPVLNVDANLALVAEQASLALGNLNGLGHMLPNPMLFVHAFIRKEALASTRIEGTRADLNQLVLFEAEPHNANATDPDSQEVVNYISALTIGWEAPREWQLSRIAIAELHRCLMQGVRGQEQHPGEFRDVPVFIGGLRDSLATARFVPPPPNEVRDMLDNLIKYADEAPEAPQLIRLAVLHYQFETIHPFRDGNGRLGRLLLPLHMKQWGMLDQPLLYLSEYFERYRTEYIDHLYAVSTRGAWTGWIEFFLEAVRIQATDAIRRARALLELQADIRSRYRNERSSHILTIVEKMFEDVAVTYSGLEKATGASPSTVNGLVRRLVDDGILYKASDGPRNQVFVARQILDVLTADFEPDEAGGTV